MYGNRGGTTAFYNGTAEQWIKEAKNAVKWTRLSCTSFRANAVGLQVHALAYNLANFIRTLALPGDVERWSLTSLREKVVKIGAKVVSHGRYPIFQMAEVAVPRDLLRASSTGSRGCDRRTWLHADARRVRRRGAGGRDPPGVRLGLQGPPGPPGAMHSEKPFALGVPNGLSRGRHVDGPRPSGKCPLTPETGEHHGSSTSSG